MCSGEATNTYFIVFGLTRLGLEPAIEAITHTITAQMRLNYDLNAIHFYWAKLNIKKTVAFIWREKQRSLCFKCPIVTSSNVVLEFELRLLLYTDNIDFVLILYHLQCKHVTDFVMNLLFPC